ncbi:MAG: cell division protein FtsW [Anaerolineae bacterium]|nr:cell division protein FtsW [Anaerolineae bacterium]
MADQPILDLPPVSEPSVVPRPVRSTPRAVPRVAAETAPAERRRGLLAALDGYMLLVVGLLLAIGLMMVYSTTFDWSFQSFGSEFTVFMTHVRNMVISTVVLLVLAFVDYRIWRRLAVILLLVTIGALIAVLLFGDDVFNARRALINGSFQPGELAELVVVIYMAAWLSSRRTQIRSVTYGLLPFAILVGIVAGLVLRQPDISTAATIVIVAGVMFFLAGADLIQIALTGAIVGVIGFVYVSTLGPDYAQGRLSSYVSGVSDLTEADYHVQQAIIAFNNGGLTGVGLGQSKQKFLNLPAPHTDSIFAVIGEELGLVGASFVVLLYIVLVIRGIQVARRSADYFGALLAAGVTIWIALKALLNIAVMTAMVPPTGASLPFISYGGSSLMVVMAGIGLLLSVARVRARQTLPRWSEQSPERRNVLAYHDRSRGNGGPRLPRPGRSRSDDHAHADG